MATKTVEDQVLSLSGWNTWDTYSVSSVVYAPTGLRVRIGVVNTESEEAVRDVLLPDMLPGRDLVGPRTADGSYIEWRIQLEGFRLLLQFAGRDAGFVWRIVPELWRDQLRLEADLSRAWGEALTVVRSGDTWTADGFHVNPLTPVTRQSTNTTMTLDVSRGEALIAARTTELSVATLDEALDCLERARAACVRDEFRSDGYLRTAAQGLSRGAFWNTIWEPRRNRPLPTFSRRWNVRFKGFVDAPADNFAQAASTGLFHEHLAYLNIEEMITEANSEGMIPNIGAANGSSHDRSEPPNGSHSALKLYRSFGDKAFLARVYPGLARWNRWWYSHRDGNGDGLFEWGADPITDPSSRWYDLPGSIRARLELCADNSALYDHVEFNEEAHTFEMTDVGLNGYLALDAWSLQQMALILGREDDAVEFGRKYEHLEQMVNAELWNEEHGIYLDRHWDGRWCEQYEPQLFFPMVAGIAPPDRTRRMIDGYFLNEDRFWGEFPLPSLSRDNPAFAENNYYRGRIWGEQVHLVAEGLHRYGMDVEAHEFSLRLLRMYLREWEEHSHSHENYNSVTGEGDDVKNATCDYAALGGMMAHVAIQQLVDVEAWGGLRFGNLSSVPARVSNALIGGLRHEVETGGRLVVRRDGRVLVESDVAVIVRGLHSPAFSEPRIELRLKALRPGMLHLRQIAPEVEVVARSGGRIESRKGDEVCVRLEP